MIKRQYIPVIIDIYWLYDYSSASVNSKRDVAYTLLSKETNIDHDYDYFSASVNGKRDVAYTLLSKGADINQQDKDGKTTLMIAIINGHLELVELLLKRNVDLTVKNEVTIKTLKEECRSYSQEWGNYKNS